MELLLDYLGEILISLAIVLCKIFGREATAEKLLKRKKKRYRKQEKKVKKEAKKLEEDLEVLKELE